MAVTGLYVNVRVVLKLQWESYVDFLVRREAMRVKITFFVMRKEFIALASIQDLNQQYFLKVNHCKMHSGFLAQWFRSALRVQVNSQLYEVLQ